jgi:hypothetical protein
LLLEICDGVSPMLLVGGRPPGRDVAHQPDGRKVARVKRVDDRSRGKIAVRVGTSAHTTRGES